MQTKVTLLATTALVVMAFAAPAEAAGSGWYVSLTGGANWIDDNDIVLGAVPTSFFTAHTEADTGFVVGGAVGMSLGNFMNGLRVEVEAAYRQNNVDGTYGTNSGGTPQSGVLEYDHSSFSVLANVWVDIPLGSSITPYVGGGLGWADVNVDGSFTCTFGFCSGSTVSFDNSEDGFAWQAGAGVNIAISPNVQLGVGYRYFQGPEPFLAAPFTTSFTHDVDNGNHAAVATLTFGM